MPLQLSAHGNTETLGPECRAGIAGHTEPDVPGRLPLVATSGAELRQLSPAADRPWERAQSHHQLSRNPPGESRRLDHAPGCGPAHRPGHARRTVTGTATRTGQALLLCGVLAVVTGIGTALSDDEVDRALVLITQERYAEAGELLGPLIEREPHASRARLAYGLLRSREGKTEEAIAIFENLQRDRPDLFEPYNNLAVLYAGQGRLEAAREALVTALERKPEAVVYANLGDVYQRLAARAHARAREISTAGYNSPEPDPAADDALSLAEPPDDALAVTTEPVAEPQAPPPTPAAGGTAVVIEPLDDAPPATAVAADTFEVQPLAPPDEEATTATTVTGSCVRASGFRDRDDAAAAAEWIQAQGAEVIELRHEEHQVVKSHWVYLPAFETRGAAVAEMRELHRQGVRDVAIVEQDGPGAIVSLGVYRSRDNMRRRVAQLEQLGYAARVAPETAISSEYVITAQVAGTLSAFDEAWAARFPGHPIRQADCPGRG